MTLFIISSSEVMEGHQPGPAKTVRWVIRKL